MNEQPPFDLWSEIPPSPLLKRSVDLIINPSASPDPAAKAAAAAALKEALPKAVRVSYIYFYPTQQD